jgi:hypothetical protein
MKTEDLKTEWEEVVVFVERNQIKYFVSQTQKLLQVSCASDFVAITATCL